jgi:twitching motility protein PilT
LRKISEILSVPNLTDIHITLAPNGVLAPDGGNSALSRFRISGNMTDEERIKIDLPEISRALSEKSEQKSGLCVQAGTKKHRLRLTPSESLGHPLMFIRVLPESAPPIEAVSAEYFFQKMRVQNFLGSGLILVSGAAGSGKSTYIASVLQHIVEHFPIHIVSLEDPVEYLIAPKKGYATQKEVYFDSPSFKTALRACMREDPDMLFIGEIRDRETAETALSAAESGHLVFGTIHAGSNAGIVDRLLGLFGDSSGTEAAPTFTAQRISQCLRMCVFITRSGTLAKYAYEEVTDSLKTVIRKRTLHSWMLYSSEVTKEIDWGKSAKF